MGEVSVAAPAPSRLVRHGWRVDAAVLAVVALLIRLPAFFASRHLSYDDGFFGLVAVEMRHGVEPYRDLFMPQGPLHPVLLFLADLLGFRTTNAPRLLPLLAGIAVTVATYAAARRITSRYGALVAAILVTTSGSVLWVTAGTAADGAAIALAVAAVALALRYGERPSTATASGAGVCAGAAVAAKALAGPVALPVALLVYSRRRPRDLVWAALGAAAVPLATALAWGLGLVWEQSVDYNRGASRLESHWGAVTKIVRTLVERDLLLLVAAALPIALVGLRLLRSTPTPADRSWLRCVHRREPVASVNASQRGSKLFRPATVLALWLALEVALLVIEPALWSPHVSQLVAPAALLIALRPPPLAALLVAAVLVAPWYYDHLQPMLRPGGYEGAEATAVDALRELPAGALVISDTPGFVWRAGRRTSPWLADSSIKRIEQGQINAARLAAAARAPDVCAVLVWTDRYRDLDLGPRLEQEGYQVSERYGGPRVLYERSRCRT
jgi:4-amino-4-deoxy-L-arabinose transferase-like glycosyltransferase